MNKHRDNSFGKIASLPQLLCVVYTAMTVCFAVIPFKYFFQFE